MCEKEEGDLYTALGASSGDSVQQLRHRYRQLALKYHPDRFRGDTSSEAESALMKFLEIDAAWRILRDDNSRRQYDLQMREQGLKQEWPVDSAVCLEDMTWDPDEGVYTYSCRCGGAFCISEEETQRKETGDELQETEDDEHKAAVVCCDTCSLSVHVTWSSQKKTHE